MSEPVKPISDIGLGYWRDVVADGDAPQVVGALIARLDATAAERDAAINQSEFHREQRDAHIATNIKMGAQWLDMRNQRDAAVQREAKLRGEVAALVREAEAKGVEEALGYVPRNGMTNAKVIAGSIRAHAARIRSETPAAGDAP